MKTFKRELNKWIRSKGGKIEVQQGIMTISFKDGTMYDFTVPMEVPQLVEIVDEAHHITDMSPNLANTLANIRYS